MTTSPAAAGRRPNVLFLLADDHRFQAIHSNGDPVVRTPTLDALAARGVSFQGAYIHGGCSAAVCVPSRAALHTGVNPFRAHEQTDGTAAGEAPRHSQVRSGRIRPELALLGETFRHAGYATFATGKWHNDKASFHRSFGDAANVFFGGMCAHGHVPVQGHDPTGLYGHERERVVAKDSSVLFADSAIDFLRGHDAATPFLLYAAFTAPHDPRTPPPLFRAMYPEDTITMPSNFLPQHPFDNGELSIRDELLAAFPRDPAEIRRHIAEYYGMISHLDHELGRVLRALEDTGRADNTIVVYAADHGIAVGQHGLLGKQNLYDHSIRVPLVIAGPGVPPGARPQGLVYSHDLFPTLCELCGIQVPDTVEARSLRPAWAGGEQGRESIFSAYKGLQRMLRRGPWKLIEYTVPGQPLRRQLFDLASDPTETRDLAGEPAQRERVRTMSAELERQRVRFGAPEPSMNAITTERPRSPATIADQLGRERVENSAPAYLAAYRSLYASDPRAAGLQWFRDAKYGLFLHYGLYSLLGRHEWVQLEERIRVADYARLADEFRASGFDAETIADFAVEAGMRYVNLTTRHHDSFCLFRTTQTPFNSVTGAPARRDLVGELAAACARRGLGLCLYYSHGRDWKHPHAPNNDGWGGRARPEYDPPEPTYATGAEHNLDRYLEFMREQIRELLTQYGPIAAIWLDGIAVPLSGDAARFRTQELYDFIRSLQPQVLVSYKQGLTGTEDFFAPEHHVPTGQDPKSKQGLIANQPEKLVEICTTMAPGSWGYKKDTAGHHLSAEQVWEKLRTARRVRANLLLNTAPLPDGSLDPEDVAVLREVGKRIRAEGCPE